MNLNKFLSLSPKLFQSKVKLNRSQEGSMHGAMPKGHTIPVGKVTEFNSVSEFLGILNVVLI